MAEDLSRDSVALTNLLLEQGGGTGSASDEAWTGDGDGTAVSVLKAIHAQNETIISLLTQIEVNTNTGA